jgi:hypothetical protein
VPFLVLAPSLVIAVGVLAAFLMAALGTRELGIQSDSAAALRAKLLAVTVAARLRSTPEEERAALVEQAARRSGAELLLVDGMGHDLPPELYDTLVDAIHRTTARA